MNLTVTDSELHELESSLHQTSGICDSESGVSSPRTNKYSYHGTFGPGMSDHNIDQVAGPLADLLNLRGAYANRRGEESKSIENADLIAEGSVGLSPPKMKPPMVHLAVKFCQSEAPPNIQKNIGLSMASLNDSEAISSVNEVEEPDSEIGD